MSAKEAEYATVNEAFRETLDGLRQDAQKALLKLQANSMSNLKAEAEKLSDLAWDISRLIGSWSLVICRDAGKEE